MARIRPFSALRPPRELVARVAAPPYDVVSTTEARTLAAGNPDSFLRISRPEVALDAGATADAVQVHELAKRALADFRSRGVLVPGPPALLVYRQQMALPGRGEVVQTGVVGCASAADYLAGRIAVHEHTRPDKENDRTQHILALAAHDEPVFLMYRPDAPGAVAVAAAVGRVVVTEPEYDLVADGVRHQLWLVPEGETEALVAAFEEVPKLYVADGHHRSAAAARAWQELGTDGAAEFPAVVFPADELTVLPYNRVVADLNGLDSAALLAALDLEVVPVAVPDPDRHEFGMYLDGRWHVLRAPVDESDPIANLDVSVLQERVLGPLLGIADVRTDQRIAFIGGIRGAAELERLVNSGAFAVAFLMHPTSPFEVMAVADLGQVMPPKSTWFEPKLRSGLFLHPID